MLNLTIHKTDKILLGVPTPEGGMEDYRIVFIQKKGSAVCLGVDAPKKVAILRCHLSKGENEEEAVRRLEERLAKQPVA